ncbi:MAG: flagellar hook-associated protein FlgK [Pseudomonadota bacterium]
MTDLLQVGTRSLVNIQTQLGTTGHNIANANTDGYSRQTVNVVTQNSQRYGFGYVGQGATIGSIDRAFDGFLNNQLQTFTSSHSQYESFVGYSNRLNDLMADSKNNISGSLQTFFNSLQDVAANPSGLPQRQVLLADAESLIYRQQSLNDMLNKMGLQLNDEMTNVVGEINGFVDEIAMLNKEIISAVATANGMQPNDLLDQRDRMIRALAEKVAVTSVPQQDGSVNIFVGRGQALVVGSETTHLDVRRNPYDSSLLEIGIEGQQSFTSISRFLDGGQLQGLLDFRNRSLLPAQDGAGLIVLAMTQAFNEQHELGVDLNGNAGSAFFNSGVAEIHGHVSNTGTTEPALTVVDASAVKASDYRVSYNGTQWELTRLSDNTSVSGTGILELDGMELDVSSGTPVTGDSFQFNPARAAGNQFTLAIRDTAAIAAASAVRTTAATANTGATTISGLQVTDPSFIPLSAPVSLEFSPDALGVGQPGFIVNGGSGGTLAYDPTADSAGKSFTLGTLGVTFTVSGKPNANDSFSLGNNTGARGDNSNALQLAALKTKPTINGTQTLQNFYGSIVAQVGVSSRQADANLTVEASLLQQAEQYRENVSGVNLDEEAANMLRYQQAYQASAQIIKIANDVFATLMNSLGA